MPIVQSSMKVVAQPRAEGPELVGGEWIFQCLGLKLGGSAQLGDKSPPGAAPPVLPAARSPIGMGWRIGWVQVNAQEWYWALYRQPGANTATLLKWPTYSAIDNEDRSGGDLFYAVKDPFYRPLEARNPSGAIEFVDMPIARFKPRLPLVGGEGELASVGIRLSFVCALAARAPDDALFILRWVPWFVQWGCDFVGGGNGLVPQKRAMGTKAAAGEVQTGVPVVLKQAIDAASGATANVLANAAPVQSVLSGPMIEQELQRLRSRG